MRRQGKPHLRPTLGGWAVHDSDGLLQEWFRDYREACRSAKTVDARVALETEVAERFARAYQTNLSRLRNRPGPEDVG